LFLIGRPQKQPEESWSALTWFLIVVVSLFVIAFAAIFIRSRTTSRNKRF